MHRSLSFVALFLILASQAWTQPITQLDLNELNAQRLRINQRGMIALGSWAVANIGYSGVQMARTEGRTKSFHQMNVAWNAVNLGIAGLSYWGGRRAMGKEYDLATSVKEQRKVELSLMFNSGLDVGYMAFGLYLRERSFRELGDRRDRFNGWGNSLILQGGFLFVFDVVMSVVHQRHGNRGVMKLLERVQPASNGIGLSISLD